MKIPLITKSYRISIEQDKAVKKAAKKQKKSESEIIRTLLDTLV